MNIKSFLLNYFLRIVIINFTGIFFLYDTLSFNQGLISVQSLIYSINTILLIIFLFIETFFSFVQYYGLEFEFIKLVFLNLKNLDYNFVKLIILDKNIYIFFFIINIILLLNLKKITQIVIRNKKFLILNKLKLIISFLSVFLIIIFLPFEFNKRILNKIINFENTINQYSIFRDDNWFISLRSYISNKKINITKIKNPTYINDFSEIIDTNKFNNIYIIINESYPNFKDTVLKEKLHNIIIADHKNDIIIKNYKKDWSKKYSTQGAELNLFCGLNKKFIEFQRNNLDKFIKENNCYFKNYNSINKVFIHSHKISSFNRQRYTNFFDQTIGFHKLDYLNLDICKGAYLSYCDHQLLNNLKKFNSTNKNLIIFLTVNNHIPTVLISKTNTLNCKDYFPLYLNDQFCKSFHNQVHFNKSLSNFISELKKKELIIFFSDTPPLFPTKERIYFEDYIDVYTFEKK